MYGSEILKKMIDHSRELIFAIDEDLNFRDINSATTKVWKYVPEELIGKSFLDLVHGEERQSIREDFKETLTGRETEFINHFIRKDNTAVLLKGNLKWDKDQRLFYGAASEINEGEVLNSVANDSASSFRYLFMANPSPMVIWDFETGKFIECNKEALRTYGYTREEFLQLTIRDIRPKEDIPLIEAATRSESDYEAAPTRWRHLKKSGELMYIEIRSHIIDFNGTRAAFVHLNNVTDRVLSEEELLHTYKKVSDYKFALDVSSIIAITDPKGTITYVNDYFCDISKFNRDELIGKNHRIINSGYHDKRFFVDLWKTISQGDVWRGEIKNRAKDGTTYWVDSTIVPFMDEMNRPYQYMALRFDITDKKAAEEDIQIKTKLLSAITEVISILFQYDDWVVALDRSFGIVGEAVSVDRVYYFENFFDPGSGEGFANQIVEWSKHGTHSQINNPELQHLPFDTIADFITPLSQKEPFRAIVSQMPDSNTKKLLLSQDIKAVLVLPIFIKNHFYGFIGFDDCTQERHWRDDEVSFLQTLTSKLSSAIDKRGYLQALKEALEEKNTILESIGDAFFAVNKDWEVTYWNKKAERILGTKKEEILGKNLKTAYEEERYSSFYNQYARSVSQNIAIHFEEYYDRRGIWLEVSAYPSPTGLAVYFKDISERKMNEEKLKKINKELALSNSELEQFAFVASHDLQEPLRMITSFLAQLEKKYGDLLDEKGKRYIYFASDGAKRMRNIILDLLEFSRVGRTEEDKEWIDIGALVEEAISLNRKLIQEKKAKVTWQEGLPRLYSFRTPLRLLLQNLINNGLKYQEKNSEPVISISYEETKTHWQFVVADNGIGIDAEYYDKIFTIFQRLHNKDQYSGTGVGLAICKKIIENLEGRIWVKSEQGVGSKFYFTLPK